LDNFIGKGSIYYIVGNIKPNKEGVQDYFRYVFAQQQRTHLKPQLLGLPPPPVEATPLHKTPL
jgi:hypothetical protein